MAETKTLSRSGLLKMLRLYDGKQFWSIRTVTKPDLIQTGRVTGNKFQEVFGFPPERLRKVSNMVIGLGYDYSSVVANRLVKEDKSKDEFKRGKSWHCPAYEDSTIIRKHEDDVDGTGTLYVSVNCIANNTPQVTFVDIESGAEIDKERLSEFLKKTYKPKNQGLDNPVIYRMFKVEGIEEMTCNGITYQVTDV